MCKTRSEQKKLSPTPEWMRQGDGEFDHINLLEGFCLFLLVLGSGIECLFDYVCKKCRLKKK